MLAIWVRLRPRPVRQGAWTPKVSIVLAARNEEASLPGKIENLLRLDYPPELREIVIASDGSTDRTNVILREQAEDVAAVILGAAKGKANALNAAVRAAKGEILVFLDVRQTVDALAIRELVSPFADPGVGAVSGELLLEAAAGQGAESALGIYWKIEKTVRKLESASGFGGGGDGGYLCDPTGALRGDSSGYDPGRCADPDERGEKEAAGDLSAIGDRSRLDL